MGGFEPATSFLIAERGSSETNRKAKLQQAKKVLSEIPKRG